MSTVTTAEGCLDTLLSPISREEFVRHYWPDRLCVAHGPIGRLTGLSDLVTVNDITYLFALPRRAISVQFQTRSGETGLIPNTDPRTAMVAYENGCQLYFHLNATDRGPFQSFFDGIKRELSVPIPWGEIGIYATREGGPAHSMHFDGNENIMVQLEGEKSWQVAANTTIAYPGTNYVVTRRVPARPFLNRQLGSDIARVASAALPDRMPSDSETIVMKPGSAAYIPRGYWHATEAAAGGSISIACTWDSPSIGELVLARALGFVTANPNWRRPASLVMDYEERVKRDTDSIDDVLRSLPTFLQELEHQPRLVLQDIRRLRELI